MHWSNEKISKAKHLRDLGWTNVQIASAVQGTEFAVKSMFWREDNRPAINKDTRRLNEPYNPLKAMIERLDKRQANG